MKKLKKIGIWMLTMTMLFVQMIGVHAEGTQRQTKSGVVSFGEEDTVLEITSNEGKSLVGKTFQVHQLFEAENAVGMESIDYTLNPTYASALKTVVGNVKSRSAETVTEYEIIDYMQSLSENLVEGAQATPEIEGRYSEYRYFVETLAEAMKQENLTGDVIEITSVDVSGGVQITGLSYGYYMVLDVSEAIGKHAAVSMPILNTVNPKSSIQIKADYPSLIEKIQEDSDGSWNDIADFEIGQNVPYRYRSEIPDINGYHTYYYAWHTESEEALTLQTDTVQILLEGEVDHADKTYQLKSDEYQIVPDASNMGFVIEVSDIKSIVDREFPNKDENQENIYGQEVTVLYQAVLNDKAALDTGRPGFENDVRLEFSNNPNEGGETETGFTAWDSVVCFTYQLQGRKINNYGTNLEGANFRLYADEECQDEILVKKVANRYHVMHADKADASQAVSVVSDANGDFVIAGLDADTYYLKEVQAPAGYRALLSPITLQIQTQFPEERNAYVKGEGAEEEFLVLSAKAIMNTVADGVETKTETELEVDQDAGSVALAVVNQVGSKLPASGSYAILAIVGACIILFGVAMGRGRKKHE